MKEKGGVTERYHNG